MTLAHKYGYKKKKAELLYTIVFHQILGKHIFHLDCVVCSQFSIQLYLQHNVVTDCSYDTI